MKVNSSYIYNTTINAVFKYCKISEIAEEMHSILKKKYSNISINEVRNKSNGIIFRNKGDEKITDDEIIKTFIKTICNLVEGNLDLTLYLNDQYDIYYNESTLSYDFVKSFLDIHYAGRLIYIEFDI